MALSAISINTMNRYPDRSRCLQGAIPRGITRLTVFALVGVALGSIGEPVVAGAQQSAATAPLVFDGVTVVDVELGKDLPAQRVVILGNRIKTIGSVATVKVPSGARVVDARGKYLIPGLWDAHTHSDRYVHFFYPLFIAYGVTGIRDAGSQVPVDTLVLWRREILAGKRVGPPRQILSGQSLDESPHSSCKRVKTQHTCVTDSADALHLIDSLRSAGADMLKTYLLGRKLYFTIAAEARRMGIPFGGHLNYQTAAEASDSGASIIDHINTSGGLDKLCLIRRASIEKCQPLADRLRRNGTWFVPTWMATPEGEGGGGVRSHPIRAYFDEYARRFWTDSILKPYRPPGPAVNDTANGPSHWSVDSLGYMYVVRHAGLPILAGTDVWDVNNMPGLSLHVELAMYAAEGMTPLEALQTATLNPAKWLHATDSLGTVAPGKLADLILLDADPLLDINNTTAIRAVVANGRYFDRAALDGLLKELKAKAKFEPQPFGRARW
jgi:hypothetical protein